MIGVTVIQITEIKRLHRGHWFDAKTIKFFSSRFGTTAHRVNDTAYFISSEKFDDTFPRLYSIRKCDMITGEIDTVGEFQKYKTKKTAEIEMMNIINITLQFRQQYSRSKND
jgi:hypothetical protein